jgi:hypothetical protein
MQAGARTSQAHEIFLLEVKSALMFLRDHSVLRYQQNTAEYESRRRVAIDAVLRAVQQRTGVDLPPVYGAMHIEDLREVSMVSVRRLLKGTLHTLKRSMPLADRHGATDGLARAIHAWEKAVLLL